MAKNNIYALKLNPDSGRVEIPSSESFKFDNKNFTIMMWLNPTSWGSTWIPIIVKAAEYWSKSDWGIWKHPDTNRLTFNYGNNGGLRLDFTTTVSEIPLNKWTHLAVVRVNDKINLFINGVFKSSVQIGNYSLSYNSDTPLKLGAAYHPNMFANTFNGSIDEVSIWKRDLSIEEINFFKERAILKNRESLAAYWRFYEGEGNIVHDKTEFNNHGTIYNSTWIEGGVDLTIDSLSLIKSSNKIQILTEDGWQGVEDDISKELFYLYGYEVNDLISIPQKKLNELEKPYSILTWTDEEVTTVVLDYIYEQHIPKFLEIETDTFSPMKRLNQEDEFEVITWTDNKEELPASANSTEETVDEGKLFKVSLEDFVKVTGVEVN